MKFASNTRTDVHRPSVVQTSDYEFVAFENIRDAYGILVTCQILMEERERIREHMAQTGGTYSRHQHGGSCHICGAHAIWTVLFYHCKTNSYIRTGHDCAELLQAGLEERFRRWKKSVDNYLQAVAGKRKAKKILEDAGLLAAWNEYETPSPTMCPAHLQSNMLDYEVAAELRRKCPDCQRLYFHPEESTVRDIVGKLVRYGSISERQMNYLRSLLDRIVRRDEIEAKRAAERAAAADCPTGRIPVRGVVVKAAYYDSDFGSTFKATVKTDAGWLVWVTVPSSASASRGDRVRFTATVTPSSDDPKFGFGKRPTGWITESEVVTT